MPVSPPLNCSGNCASGVLAMMKKDAGGARDDGGGGRRAGDHGLIFGS